MVFANEENAMAHQEDWRCVQCGKLLGRIAEGRLHIRYERGNEYLVALPVTSTCRKCGTLNERRDMAAMVS